MTRREQFRKGLSTLYLPYYDALCETLPEEFQPYCGLRTFDEQAILYSKGRSSPGKIVTNSRPGQSPHNYGCASDWCLIVDKMPFWPIMGDSFWKEYQQACEKVGLRWGGDWNRNGRSDDERFIDFPHNELVISCSWKHILMAHAQGGMLAAQQKIEVAHGL